MSREITANKDDDLLIAYPESTMDMPDPERFAHYVKLKFPKSLVDKLLPLYPDFDVKYHDTLADLYQNRRLFAFFHGEVGTGKSFSAIIAVMLALKQRWRALINNVQILESTAFLSKLQRHLGQTEYYEILDTYRKCDFLIFDDFGMNKMTEWSVDTFTEIVMYRYTQNLSTIFTSNHDLKELVSFGLARSISRIADMCKGNIIRFTENLRNDTEIESRDIL